MISTTETDDRKAIWDDNVQYCCTNATGEINHDWDFTIICNSKHFIVTVSPGLPEDPVTSLLTQFSKAFDEDDDEKIQDAQDAIMELVFDAGWQTFRAIAPPIPEGNACARTSTQNLYSELNPEKFYLRLIVTEGRTEIVRTPPPRPQPDSIHLNLGDNPLNLPRYFSRDISVMGKLVGSGYIARVMINGLDMCCKIATAHSFVAVQREYDCLKQISLSKNEAYFPVPKLLGLVVDDDGSVIGILEEFIANEGRLSDLAKKDAGVSSETRAKWAKQIQDIVALLHEIDVVWGDGKAENVLIRSGTDDCFLIDFGGSYTHGWVDRELMESRAGDNQAVEKIVKFLSEEGRT
ncbi:hypothetical protein ONS95_011634 [Cadophora gregata]|uniref:uncharacterized protein n=1 Tax=Cadophora gregata TaxID=51156 RepID=UPI0026DBBA6F|nr:uncharacterized protein ONS95_011634 [Cadophora gregata]KAK0120228.1 hypothetical protein ONS95_011634 [Cadophora gregata]KAK0121263.1 hypothetical protein ONS96_011438 [Cadophora gregata f. sp. sojae]